MVYSMAETAQKWKYPENSGVTSPEAKEPDIIAIDGKTRSRVGLRNGNIT
jgi:hypothetical protein